MAKKKEQLLQGMTEQNKDALTGLVASIVVMWLIDYFFLKSFASMFGLSNTIRFVILTVGVMFGAGVYIGTVAKHKAHQKIAYGK